MDTLPQGTIGEFHPNHDESEAAAIERYRLYEARWNALHATDPDIKARAQQELFLADAREAVERAFDQPRKEQHGQ